ncbi:MAG: hypothetical protein QW587_08415 [Candidatus Bathyarchaeia archaeon]
MRGPSLWLMLHGAYPYYRCSGLIRASRALEPLVKRSRVAAWHWVQRLAPIADRFDADRRLGRRLLMDEAMVHVRGVEAWV